MVISAGAHGGLPALVRGGRRIYAGPRAATGFYSVRGDES